MRVISGKFKGHRLVSFDADHLRPTMDRVKESLFNKIQTRTAGARFLDLFSGTGSLSIEALSRDAASVVAVENSAKSLKILRENLAKLKIKEGIQVQPMDVFKFLERFDGEPFDVIMVDPPFTQKLADQVMTALAVSKVHGPGTLIFIESGTREPIGDSYSPLNLLDRREYGDKTVSYFARA